MAELPRWRSFLGAKKVKVMDSGSKGLIIHGCIGAETLDSSGEQLIVRGADISSMEKDGVLNWEHASDTDGPSAIIGKCIKCKKIYGPEDCANKQERRFWDEVKFPLIYAQFRLFDAQDHAQAKAAAAIIRDQKENGEPITLRFSLEGSTLHMSDDKRIMESIVRRCALTSKPCNKVAISDILRDPQNPAEATETSLFSKFEHPSYQHIVYGAVPSVTVEVDDVEENFAKSARELIDLAKAIEGGNYNAAPSTLTGGAALQREDLGEENRKRLINVTKGALRDHDPAVHGPFRQYLKSLLPEASSDFLDTFEDVANELNTSKLKASYLKKADEEKPAARRGGQKKTEREQLESNYQETLSRIKEARAISFPDEEEGGKIPPVETKAFKRVKPRDLKRGDNIVDEKNGVVYVGGTEANPPRVHKLYAPSVDDAHYMTHLTDPKINEIHDRAMKNWVLMNRLNRSGKLPPEVIAHAGLFSLMSPNTAVPIQELAFGHLMDMKNRGFDPTKAYDPLEMKQYEKEFASLAAGQAIPELHRDHFLSEQAGIWRKPYKFELEAGGIWDPKTMRRNPDPEQKIRHVIGLPEGKWDGVEHYHELHAVLADLVAKHGTDARAISTYLNQLKHDKENYKGRVAIAEKKGKPTPEDPRAGEPEVRRFAPKTIRYMLGMLGGGNVVVPDTHFLRHTFGLHPDDPRIGDVKAAMLKPRHEPLLQSVDNWYRAKHPAFEWTRQKLQRQYGEDFGEQATFPSFWLHWLTIAPHERASKWPTEQAGNEGTDHGVFWNSVHSILDKYNLPHDPHDPSLRLPPRGQGDLFKAEAWTDGGSLPARTAHAMKEVENRFGETAASFAYFSYLAPLLLAPSKPPELYKAELLARLAKGEYSEDSKKPKIVMHKGAAIEPGEVEFVAGPQAGNRLPLVSIGKDYHHVLSPEGGLMKLKAGHPSTRIVKEPRIARTNTMVDSKKHGHPTLHGTDIQHDIIHGLDMAKRIGQPKLGITWKEHGGGDAGWYQSAEGHLAFVKPNAGLEQFIDNGDPEEFGPAHREAAFYRLADGVFGLGEYVPPTTVFKHPVTGKWHSAQQKVEGEHYSRTSMFHKESLGQMARTGLLDKLTLMDMVLGHFDRHTENGLISSDGRKLHLIDNGLAFPPKTPGHPEAFVPMVSEYWKAANKYNDGDQWYTRPLHPDALQWVESLNPQKLAEKMDRLGVPKSERDESIRRLTALKARVAKGNVTRGAAYYAPFLKKTTTPEDKAMMEFGSGLTEPVQG